MWPKLTIIMSQHQASHKHTLKQYSEILNENAKNSGSVWELFKEIGAIKRKNIADLLSLKINDCIIENSKDIAYEFNIFCKCSIKNHRGK